MDTLINGMEVNQCYLSEMFCVIEKLSCSMCLCVRDCVNE